MNFKIAKSVFLVFTIVWGNVFASEQCHSNFLSLFGFLCCVVSAGCYVFLVCVEVKTAPTIEVEPEEE